jgi:DNA replication protein DnaD
MAYDYTKSVLESVSSNVYLFSKELKKALRTLLPFEIEKLQNWLKFFTSNRPDLQSCVVQFNLQVT